LNIWYEHLYGEVESPLQARGFGGRAPNQSLIDSAVPIFTLERMNSVDVNDAYAKSKCNQLDIQ
jgi:hypothetical protein